ncbi:uncharacterized protein LAESUDRAFT_630464, partial [Laetiporus sulphureus 93-53]
RGKVGCGDLDILITRPTSDRKTHQSRTHLLYSRRLLQGLHERGIITENLSLPDVLELVYRGLCR